MKRKSNGKTPARGLRKTDGVPPSTGDDPKSGQPEDFEDRDSGLKQAGLRDLGGTGPRKKGERRH